MKKETLKKANALADKIQAENNTIAALRQWSEEIRGERGGRSKRNAPFWEGTLDSGKGFAIYAPVDKFCFMLDMERAERIKYLGELEADLAALQDEGPVSDVEYEER